MFLNSNQGEQNEYLFSLDQDVNFSYGTAIILNAEYHFLKSYLDYTNLNTNNISNYSHKLGLSGIFKLPKKITLNSEYTYSFNPQIAQGFSQNAHLVNVAISLLTQKKDRGELKLSIYDILNQNISVSRFARVNAVVINEQSILRRYIMLKYQYRFNALHNK